MQKKIEKSGQTPTRKSQSDISKHTDSVSQRHSKALKLLLILNKNKKMVFIFMLFADFLFAYVTQSSCRGDVV